MTDVKYCENVIAAVVHAGKFRWYVSPMDFWYLDYEKYLRAFNAFAVPDESVETSERFGITILNQDSASTFTAKAIQYEARCEILRSELREQMQKMNEFYRPVEYIPVFYVNFDQREFLSQFPEPVAFETYAPDGWLSHCGDVENRVPKEERYWTDNGEDYFETMVKAWKPSIEIVPPGEPKRATKPWWRFW